MLSTLHEGSVTFKAYRADTPSEAMPVFYNPRMRVNRDISVLTLRLLLDEWFSRGVKHLRLAFPLVASGVRVKRVLLENEREWHSLLDRGVFIEIILTDMNPKAIRLARENLSEASIKALQEKGLRLVFETRDANESLLLHKEYDYVNIDPYGSPNPFLATTFLTVKHNAIIEITQTDTAPLAGSAPKAALRKYHATAPFQPRYKHFTALLLFAGHVERVASMHNLAIDVLLAVHEEHYNKLVIRVAKNEAKAVKHLAEQRMLSICPACHTLTLEAHAQCPICTATPAAFGPARTRIAEKTFISKILAHAKTEYLSPSMRKDLERLAQLPEDWDCVLDTHQLSRGMKKKETLSRARLTECIQTHGGNACTTPFHPTSLILTGRDACSILRACLETV